MLPFPERKHVLTLCHYIEQRQVFYTFFMVFEMCSVILGFWRMRCVVEEVFVMESDEYLLSISTFGCLSTMYHRSSGNPRTFARSGERVEGWLVSLVQRYWNF